MKGAAWTVPTFVVVPAARAASTSPQPSGVLNTICAGSFDVGANTIEATVQFGVLVPAGATVAAGASFVFSVSTDPPASTPAALAVSGLSASTSVSGSGPSYTYTITVTAPYTNTSGSDVFFPGGVAWTGANALTLDPNTGQATVTTTDSGPVGLDSDGSCPYNGGY